MNANKMLCKPRFFIFDANAFHNDADVKCPYDADVPCRGANAKFIRDGASAHIYTMMQMSLYRDGDANVLRCKCPSVGMS